MHTQVEGKLAQIVFYVIVVFAANWSTVAASCKLLRAHLVYSGMTLQLQCNVCNQRQLGGDVPLVWEYQVNNGKDFEPVGHRDGLKYSDDMRTLTFLSINPEDMGKYLCKNNATKDFLSEHDVTVLKVVTARFHTIFSSRNDQAYGEGIGYLFPVRSVWTTWTSCNRCGELGERFRLGICTVYREGNPEGTPCRSNLFSKEYKEEFEDRLDEKEVAECERACPRGYKEIVQDKNYVAKLVDLHLGRPTLPPSVETRTVYVPEREDVELTCPGGGSQDAISWKNGSEIIHRSQLRGDHVFIDYMNVLHVRDASPHDALEYECFYGDEHVATVKLIVGIPLLVNEENKGKLKYSGFVFTGLVVILIFLTINKNRKLHKRIR